ncbi:MAG: hypothetical protein PHV85_01180, partial [Desulfovibrionaceae bacterium]|nr:hypothetical protein [Desulfovibrionaceae bacterium]
ALDLKRLARAAPLPCLTALACLAQAAAWALAAAWASGAGSGPALAAAAFSTAGAVICLADARSRHREYLRLKALLARFGYRDRLFALMAGSRCQRDAALMAAREAGCLDRARAFYGSRGYCRRHLLPDRVLADPRTLLDPIFLKATFFRT